MSTTDGGETKAGMVKADSDIYMKLLELVFSDITIEKIMKETLKQMESRISHFDKTSLEEKLCTAALSCKIRQQMLECTMKSFTREEALDLFNLHNSPIMKKWSEFQRDTETITAFQSTIISSIQSIVPPSPEVIYDEVSDEDVLG